MRIEPAKQYARWFGEQEEVLRERLEAARARLSEHQQKYGIAASDEKLDSETARLGDLTAQLTVAQAQTADVRSRERAGSAGSTLPEVVQNPLIHTLKGEIARQEGKLQEASGNLGRNHPEYVDRLIVLMGLSRIWIKDPSRENLEVVRASGMKCLE